MQEPSWLLIYAYILLGPIAPPPPHHQKFANSLRRVVSRFCRVHACIGRGVLLVTQHTCFFPRTPLPPLHTQHLLGEFRKESGIDLSGDTLAMQRLREAAEKVSVWLEVVSHRSAASRLVSLCVCGVCLFSMRLFFVGRCRSLSYCAVQLRIFV